MTSADTGVYDIIFAGGGASACITAGRLAEADPNLKILIVEAGPHTRDVVDHIQPARFFSALTQPKETFTFHAETYQAESTNDTHGTSGPIKVSYAPNLYNIAENFLEVAQAIDPARPLTQDMNDFSTTDQYGRLERYIDVKTGKRSDTAHQYIYNQEHNTNLEVLVRHRVVRILFEGTRATGIEYVDDSIGKIGGDSAKKTARASRLVVLSAGSFGTPSILERSGIGAQSILEKNGVKQLVDLPGVGEHYLDHNIIFLPFVASEDADTLDHIFRGSKDDIAFEEEKWLKTGQGLMAQNGVNAAVKLRPNAKELASLSPDFDHRWQTYFVNAPDKTVMTMAPMAAYVGLDPAVPREKHFCMLYFTSYPVSVGRVHITSGSNPYAPTDFESGYLNDPADVVVLRWAYKRAREYARRLKYYRGDLVTAHPRFKLGSAAAPNLVASPVALSAPDIVYSPEDDEAIDEFTRMTVETTWHSSHVLDSLELVHETPRSRGSGRRKIERLRRTRPQIADCSIAPANVGSNTYNTAIAIGEKAAVIIAEDLGIKRVSALCWSRYLRHLIAVGERAAVFIREDLENKGVNAA
ncbi:alcohol oxidase-like protein [Pholiota molesta]|nr:alcohol oxidase-like protein [Pholiota molesta]